MRAFTGKVVTRCGFVTMPLSAMARGSRPLVHAQRHKHLLAVLFVDLDGFKQINDTWGHHVSDLLLRDVAQQLQACLRQSDTAARLAGNKFALLLPDVRTPNDAATVAQKVLAAFAKGVRVGGDTRPVCASIGISLYPRAGQDGNSLLRSADAAMYVAKAQGKNRYAFSDDVVPGSDHQQWGRAREPGARR